MATEKTTKKAGTSKADFVRAQPAHLSAKEIVEKAKAENVKLSETYIYKVRSKKKSTGPKKGHHKVAAKAAGGGGKRRKGTKSAFVLSLPRALSAADVVKQAKAAGILLSTKHVYTIRSANRGKKHTAGATTAAVHHAAVRHVTAHVSSHNDRGVQGQFVKLALALGTARAAELLRRLDSKISSLTLD